MSGLRAAAKSAPMGNTRWNDSFKEETYVTSAKGERQRLFDRIVTVKSHRLEFVSKTKGPTGYNELCLNWDPVQEKEIKGNCPSCAQGTQQSLDFWGYQMNRRVRAKTGEILIKCVRFTAVAANKLADLSKKVYMIGDEEVDDERLSIPDGFDEHEPPGADHRVHGFDFTLKKIDKNSKTEYEVDTTPKWASPLTEDEIEAFEAYISTYDIARAAKKGALTADAYRASLKAKGIGGDAPAPVARGKSQAEKDDEAFADDEDTVPEEAPRKVAAKAAPAPVRLPAAKAAAPAKKKASLSGDDDEVEENVRNYATADASDAPDAEDDDNPF